MAKTAAKTIKGKIALTFQERFLILENLPKESNYKVMVVKDDLIKKVTLTQKELTDHDFNFHPDGKVTSKPSAITAKTEFEFTTLEKEMISKAFVELEKKEKLTREMRNIYEQFCL